MRMTRWISMALVAVLAFAVAGIAVAHKSKGNAQPTEAAQATFTATPTDKTKTRQCTGVDGTYNITKGVYTGTSESPDPRLAGAITIKTKSVVNLDNGLGHTDGKVYLRDASTRKLKAVAKLHAVNTERGVLNGFIAGSVKKAGHRHGGTKLAANFTAAFNAEGTQLSGELGTGAGQNTAVLYGNPCQRAGRQPSSQSDGRRGDDDKRGGRRGDDDRK